MFFGFVCYCRNNPNNPRLFDTLGAVSAEGVKVDSLDYIFIKTPSVISIDRIMATLETFEIHPIRGSEGAPDILTTYTCTRQQRQAFFRNIKSNRILYQKGRETTYWFWRQPPLDTLGHPLPPPAGAFGIDTTSSSRWREYWDRCPDGDHCTEAILD